jgi:pSer/pThr/pTyr-binding forkhead associated (FHA) protein
LIGGGLLRIAGEAFDGDPEIASVAQAIAIIALAGLAAYLCALLPSLMKTAWISVQSGAAPPREYLVSRAVTSLGSGADCDIPLPNDRRIAPVHAVIEAVPDTNRHRLRHAARNVPSAPDRFPATRLNGEPLTSEKWLVDDDLIVIAGARIVFHERATFGEAALRRTRLAAPEHPLQEHAAGAAVQAPREPLAASPGAARSAVQEPFAKANTAHSRSAKTRRRTKEPEPHEIPARPVPPLGTGTIGTRLVCIAGPYRGQAFPVASGQTTIGRSMEQNTISLPADSSVSRQHARIVYENGRHAISDAGSSHGTDVNGEIITGTHTLRTGDVIGLGETYLRYE